MEWTDERTSNSILLLTRLCSRFHPLCARARVFTNYFSVNISIFCFLAAFFCCYSFHAGTKLATISIHVNSKIYAFIYSLYHELNNYLKRWERFLASSISFVQSISLFACVHNQANQHKTDGRFESFRHKPSKPRLICFNVWIETQLELNIMNGW